jgi:hypothetical protein
MRRVYLCVRNVKVSSSDPPFKDFNESGFFFRRICIHLFILLYELSREKKSMRIFFTGAPPPHPLSKIPGSAPVVNVIKRISHIL